MIELINKGGPVMWFLLGCAVVALVLFLERFFPFAPGANQDGRLSEGHL